MKFAIDRYSVGVEKEVEADEFDNQYIARRRNRFYCPECGEIVYFRAKGGTHPNQFYHKEKTESTPECDNRVDGRTELSLSQRVGLPLYLTGILSGSYQLSIGFPALGAEMLLKAAQAGYTVEISSGEHVNTLRINHSTFIENEMTLIPVNNIPAFGKNYTITITGERYIFGLQRKWSDYADGFGIYGAVFTYEETGGKKIRRGDTISTHRYYYIVTKTNLPPYKEIDYSVVGKIKIGKDEYRVLRVMITVSINDRATFSAISAFLKSYFGVWLLECQPELIPIWPPVVQKDYSIPVNNETNLICAVSSGNEKPNVYVYSEYSVKKISIQQEYGKVATISLTLGNRPTIISVDRKYVGREMVFIKTTLQKNEYKYDLNIKKQIDDLVPFDDFIFDGLLTDISFVTNGKMEMYIGNENKIFRHVAIRDYFTHISLNPTLDSIYILVESGIIKCWERALSNDKHNNTAVVIDKIVNSQKGCMVPIPRWADYMIKGFKLEGDTDLYNATIALIKNGRIHIETLKQLYSIKLNK